VLKLVLPPGLARLISLSLIVLACSPFTAGAMDDVEQARSLLLKMSAANRELDYQGVFTYEHAGVLKSIRITHLHKDGLEYERLVYLNGPRMEVVRAAMAPECRRWGDKFLSGLPMPSEYVSHLEASYELFLRGEDRIADREVRMIHVVPKDDMRYGYILAVDKETGLLLQSLLVGVNRRVLERFQFIDVSYGLDDLVAADLLAAESSPVVGDAPCVPAAETAAAGWRAEWLPPGFSLTEGRVDEQGDVALVYTDGLSFVSVFVDGSGDARFQDIQAQRGATVAQIARVTHNGREYTICVVGEIPPETAAKIASFVTPLTP